MAIPLFEEDMDIISKQGDYPGSEDGLTTEEFKQQFDLAGKLIKNFLNNTLIPMANQNVDSDKIVAFVLTKALDTNGGTMNGNIEMSGNKITGLGGPVNDNDAANKKFVENFTTTTTVKAVLAASGWSETAPYTQTITIDGLTDQLKVKAYPNVPDDATAAAALAEETVKVSDCRRAAEQMTFRCLKQKPEIDIPVIVEVYI